LLHHKFWDHAFFLYCFYIGLPKFNLDLECLRYFYGHLLFYDARNFIDYGRFGLDLFKGFGEHLYGLELFGLDSCVARACLAAAASSAGRGGFVERCDDDWNSHLGEDLLFHPVINVLFGFRCRICDGINRAVGIYEPNSCFHSDAVSIVCLLYVEFFLLHFRHLFIDHNLERF